MPWYTGFCTTPFDILKVGHHGSKTSSVKEYVEKVSPDYAVISAGSDNSYGHPHKEVIETLRDLNIKIITTCNNGAIYFESDGKDFVLKNRNTEEVEVGCK
jgi:competence protein ComEC